MDSDPAKWCSVNRAFNSLLQHEDNVDECYYYPARACAARGYVIGRGVCCILYIYLREAQVTPVLVGLD